MAEDLDFGPIAGPTFGESSMFPGGISFGKVNFGSGGFGTDNNESTIEVVNLMLGEGNGGGALALLPADRVVAAQHAWLSPLPPEGASVIVHRTTEHAATVAQEQGVRSNSATETFAARRMDASVKQALAGQNLNTLEL